MCICETKPPRLRNAASPGVSVSCEAWDVGGIVFCANEANSTSSLTPALSRREREDRSGANEANWRLRSPLPHAHLTDVLRPYNVGRGRSGFARTKPFGRSPHPGLLREAEGGSLHRFPRLMPPIVREDHLQLQILRLRVLRRELLPERLLRPRQLPPADDCAGRAVDEDDRP
jgi:hypothetical protein